MCTNYVPNFKLIGQFVPELLKIKVVRAGQNNCIHGILAVKKNFQLVVLPVSLKKDEKTQTHLNMHNHT